MGRFDDARDESYERALLPRAPQSGAARVTSSIARRTLALSKRAFAPLQAASIIGLYFLDPLIRAEEGVARHVRGIAARLRMAPKTFC